MIFNWVKFNEQREFWGTEASGVLPICRETGRIAIGLRNYWVNEPFTWGNFGGAIGKNHYGESVERLSPENNARNEFEEEVGYSGDIEMIPSYIFKSGSFKYYNYIGIVDKEFELDLTDVEHIEVTQIKWVTLDELINHDDLHHGLVSLLDNSLTQIREVLGDL
jgi:8-oxo-dGTP pyrophosphatase MutT (NUDIX family)